MKARLRAAENPTLYSKISAMNRVSGVTIVIYLNKALRLSGSGVRPKWNGFIVMNSPQF